MERVVFSLAVALEVSAAVDPLNSANTKSCSRFGSECLRAWLYQSRKPSVFVSSRIRLLRVVPVRKGAWGICY